MKQCTFLQDLEEDYSLTESLGTNPSVLLKSTHFVAKSLEPEQRKAGSPTSEYMKEMLPNSIPLSTPEEYIAYQEDSLAKICLWLEARPDLRKALEAGYTGNYSVLLGSFDQHSSSLKMSQQSLLEDSIQSWETLPRWGLMLDGDVYEHPMSGQTISETVGFYWPTPSATDWKQAGSMGDLRDRLDYAVERGATKSKVYEAPQMAGGKLNPSWVEWLQGFPIGWSDLGE